MKKLNTLFDDETGEMFFEGQSSEVFSRGHIAEIEKQFIDVGKVIAERVIYRASKKFALSTVSKFNIVVVSFLKINKKKLASILLEQFPMRGYGVPKVLFWDEIIPKAKIEVKNCFNCHGIKHHKVFCFTLAGIIAGGAEVVFDMPMKCVEVECIAKGDRACVFEVSKEQAFGTKET